jgi:Na+-translocating ferredoxin:NAD+ oxidoreductase RnfD subunit
VPSNSPFLGTSASRRSDLQLPLTLALLRFFRTPKGLLLLILVILVALAEPPSHLRFMLSGLFIAVAAACAVDLAIQKLLRDDFEFPSGAILTGLIVAMVLSPHEPWYVTALTSAIAVFSKHLFRTKSANIFNPAAFGLVATFYMFGTGQSWWGALPEVTPFALIALFALGIFITARVKKIPLVLIFLGVYFLLFTVTAYLAAPVNVAEIFRAPDFHASLFFAFFILTDPPTSPVAYRDQLVCGVIVAVASYAVFEFTGGAYYLLAGVLVGNMWEAWRRWHLAAQRKAGNSALVQEV